MAMHRTVGLLIACCLPACLCLPYRGTDVQPIARVRRPRRIGSLSRSTPPWSATPQSAVLEDWIVIRVTESCLVADLITTLAACDHGADSARTLDNCDPHTRRLA
eukprot:TRINITY_DN9253_c0_g2_i1.p1 TRINITY_DN9253_c0_g2~~TRINITY_DN9253_c0_g2_i1.p1  ORF type:complete len:105 (-),score=3.52 TRINITY_DN9253_c0_g2_i1:71-385(-)